MAQALTKARVTKIVAGKHDGMPKKTATQVLDDLAALAYKEPKSTFAILISGSWSW